jgi:ClpP class serine protease
MKGKADVTFKDNPKKKEKIDIKVINKVLDMFDSLKPNDKAKMQTTIGKSYRDLLKTVQRGR